MFVEMEQAALKPLPERCFPLFTVCVRKVDVNGFVEVGCNFYSAPTRYVGDWVIVHHNSIDDFLTVSGHLKTRHDGHFFGAQNQPFS